MRSTPTPAHIRSASPLKSRTGIFSSKPGKRYTDGTDCGVQKRAPTAAEHWDHSLPSRVPSWACRALMTSGLCMLEQGPSAGAGRDGEPGRGTYSEVSRHLRHIGRPFLTARDVLASVVAVQALATAYVYVFLPVSCARGFEIASGGYRLFRGGAAHSSEDLLAIADEDHPFAAFARQVGQLSFARGNGPLERIVRLGTRINEPVLLEVRQVRRVLFAGRDPAAADHEAFQRGPDDGGLFDRVGDVRDVLSRVALAGDVGLWESRWSGMR